jgi:formate/nitrite transporter FocA (FNT family)
VAARHAIVRRRALLRPSVGQERSLIVLRTRMRGAAVPVAPTPDEIYDRAEQEGRRRLQMSLLDQVATAFIAGVTIVFGIVALAVATELVQPASGSGSGVAALVGALAFAIGVVFLIVGRSELFSENFFDPVAAAIDERGRSVWVRLLRLWAVTLVLNLVGGAVLVAVMTVEGALPASSEHVLVTVAEEIAAKQWPATIARAVLAGALITLLSYMLKAVDSVAARILVAYMVGFLLALGPFDHVVVSALHLLFGVWLSDAVTWTDLGLNIVLSALGNIVGGLLLITLTHTAQVKAS